MKRRLLKSFYQNLCRWLGFATIGAPEQVHEGAAIQVLGDTPAGFEEALEATHIPYDENLLERASIQWQLGDWNSLAALERATLQHHPDRAKLALLAAAGLLQTGHMSAGHHYIRLARSWGCSERLLKQILVAGVHNSLGRVATILRQENKALTHFSQAIAIGAPSVDRNLITMARSEQQKKQLKRGEH